MTKMVKLPSNVEEKLWDYLIAYISTNGIKSTKDVNWNVSYGYKEYNGGYKAIAKIEIHGKLVIKKVVIDSEGNITE